MTNDFLVLTSYVHSFVHEKYENLLSKLIFEPNVILRFFAQFLIISNRWICFRRNSTRFEAFKKTLLFTVYLLSPFEMTDVQATV